VTGLNHALTGATVAAAINKPALALPAALLSHFAADVVPHWDYKIPGGVRGRLKVMSVDFILSLILLVLLAITVDARPWLVAIGGLLAIAPDTMWLPFFLTGSPSKTHNHRNLIHLMRRPHSWIQWSETREGLYVEAIWFLLMLTLIYQIHH
jgi:hypothetical protein